MRDTVLSKVRAATKHSELIEAVASARCDGGRALALGDAALRPLYAREIEQLENLGNSCADWARVAVVDGFDWRKVQHCSFHGDVLLGRFSGQVRLAEGLELSSGVYHSTLSQCVIGHDAFLRDVKLLANYVVAQGAVLHDCGSITCDHKTTFGNGVALPLGIESGGREVAIYAEMNVDIAATAARSRSDHEFLKLYARAVADYAAQATSARGIISAGAVLRNTPKVRNTYVGPHARIDGATLVADTTLLSNREEPVLIESGACVTGALLQWGSQVKTLAIVERSVLTEHSHAEEHGKVACSILGPNTGVGKGEVTSCLLGPFVGFHHQALLIATLWPEGKGNVGYGANAGSNHTSKAPDQEFWPGEGAFLGLGVNIKFPADLSRAPYSIIGTGVTTLPQKVEFPFSLINSPSAYHAGVSPAINEIFPAWLLTDNLYALKRNEGKFRARDRARRQQFDYTVFRADIVDLMRDARRRLEAVTEIRVVYTDRDIEGLGKNYVLESNRKAAVEAYRFFSRYYALMRLKDQVRRLQAEGGEEQIKSLLVASSPDAAWEHARFILHEEEGLSEAAAALAQLPEMLEEIARAVERSKARDDERGVRIIDDYAEVHVEAAQDPFVQQTWDDTRKLQSEIRQLLNSFAHACV
jgi:hypothetical protein